MKTAAKKKNSILIVLSRSGFSKTMYQQKFGKVVQKRCRLLIQIPVEFIVEILSGACHNDHIDFIIIIFDAVS